MTEARPAVPVKQEDTPSADEPCLRLRRAALEWRVVEGEVIALDAETSRYMSLNETGALLWQRLADGATRPELAALLQESCDVDADRAHADVEAFLDQLAGERLLEEA